MDVLADTHTVLWFVNDPSKLSKAVDAALSQADLAGEKIYLSAITLVEVTYLAEKGKISAADKAELLKVLLDPNEPVVVLPVSQEIALQMEQISRATVPNMQDRIIAATALVHNLPLVTCDTQLRSLSNIRTIW